MVSARGWWIRAGVVSGLVGACVGLAPGASAQVSRVSVATNGAQSNSASATSGEILAGRALNMSADGHLVAFQSTATNLDPNCTTGVLQIFVRDRTAGTTTCVSVAPNGVTPGNGASAGAAFSADGQFVAFHSVATNLTTPSCTTGVQQVFVRQLPSGPTTCVSVNTGGTAGTGKSFNPVLSADGRFVAFDSQAANLDATSCPAFPQVYVRDRTGLTTTCVSLSTGGIRGNNTSHVAAISAELDARRDRHGDAGARDEEAAACAAEAVDGVGGGAGKPALS